MGLPYRPGAGLTEQAAAEFVWRHGHGALAILVERAETAEQLGHRIAAKSWRELAYAAARLLRSDADLDPALRPPPFAAAGRSVAPGHSRLQ